MLGQIKIEQFPDVIVGTTYFDDAGVVRYDERTGIVLTVDYFTPVVDSPWDFGRIAAANSLSDIYAMGAEPIAALNIVGFPENKLPLEVLVEILSGGQYVTRQAGIPVVGGHSVKNQEPFYGLAVTGKVEIDKLMTNAASKPGDLLYLTKPIGSGLITTAAKAKKVAENIVAEAIEEMATLNRQSARAAVEAGAGAATDVTGYGLIGHLLEMMNASGVSAVVDCEAVPLMNGVKELAELDLFPGGTNANLNHASGLVDWDESIPLNRKKILCDAQTSGGLIISIPREQSGILERRFGELGQKYWIIGRVVEKEQWPVKVIRS